MMHRPNPKCFLNDGTLYSETLSSTCVCYRVANEHSVVVGRRTVRELLAKESLPMISRMAPKGFAGDFPLFFGVPIRGWEYTEPAN
jgi:hypothetical protein